jgi:tRNA threonylcarbamoyladenosine biosynthesis protein TsaB
MDARMGEVYTGCFALDGTCMQAVGDERVCPPEEALPEDLERWSPLGSGFERFEFLGRLVDGRARAGWPGASVLAALAATEWSEEKALPAPLAQPVYLRDRVAEKPSQA